MFQYFCVFFSSDTSASLHAGGALHSNHELYLHRFSEHHGKGVVLSENGRVACRSKEYSSSIVYSSTRLTKDEIFEVSIVNLLVHMAGTLSIGITETAPGSPIRSFPVDCCYLTGNNCKFMSTSYQGITSNYVGNELCHKNKLLQIFTPSLNWLNVGDRIGILQTQDLLLKVVAAAILNYAAL